MSFTMKWLWPVIVKVLEQMIKILAPEISKLLKETLLNVYEEAKKTQSPIDDWIMGHVLTLFGIPIPE